MKGNHCRKASLRIISHRYYNKILFSWFITNQSKIMWNNQSEAGSLSLIDSSLLTGVFMQNHRVSGHC